MSTDFTKLLSMKIGKIIAAIIILAFLTIVTIGLSTDKPIKLWGLEFNTKEVIKQHDTAYITRHDTIKGSLFRIPLGNSNPKKEFVQQNKNGKNEIIQNSGTNYGIQGGENNQQYNIGIQPRKIAEQDLLNYLGASIAKAPKVSFYSYGFADTEINSVKNQIITILKKHNVTNIEPNFHILINITPPDGIMAQYDTITNELFIRIPPIKE